MNKNEYIIEEAIKTKEAIDRKILEIQSNKKAYKEPDKMIQQLREMRFDVIRQEGIAKGVQDKTWRDDLSLRRRLIHSDKRG